MPFKRTLVISDIHGCFEELMELLELAKYDSSEDKLILLGDYVDRGYKSKEVVDLVIRLVKEQGAVALKGNHDDRFVNFIENKISEGDRIKFFEKGGIQTVLSYWGLELGEGDSLEKQNVFRDYVRQYFKEHIDLLADLPFFFEDEEYIYVHAGLNPAIPLWKAQSSRDYMYIKESFYKYPTVVKKIVIFGHTITKDLHGSADVWFGGDKIGIDGGCAYGYQLNGLELIRGEVSAVYKVKAREQGNGVITD